MIKINFITIIIVVFSMFLSFCLFGFTYKQLHQLKLLSQSYEDVISSQENKISEVYEIVISNEKVLKEIGEDYKKRDKNNTLRIKSIDAAINSGSKRWEKIKQLRKITKNIINNNNYKKHMDILDLTVYAGAVVDYSSEYDIPIPLILAVTRQESAFNPKAISHAGAQGLMQLMPRTARDCMDDIGKRFYNIYDIRANVQLGTFYLRKMLTKFNEEIELAVKAYNAGPNYVLKVLANEYSSYPEETIGYSKNVLIYFEEYKIIYN